jgi:Flp pilus assembly CpaE family ATPase
MPQVSPSVPSIAEPGAQAPPPSVEVAAPPVPIPTVPAQAATPTQAAVANELLAPGAMAPIIEPVSAVVPPVPDDLKAFAPPPPMDVLDQVLPPPPSTPPPSTAEVVPASDSVASAQHLFAPRVPQPGDGTVIAVMAGKGGSGKTVVATNLAIAMGLRGDPERVAIVDADLQFGDVALLLQIDPVRTLDDLVGQLDAMSDERLDAALLRHESGLRVLPAPVLPVNAGEISAKQIVEIVDRMRSMYDVIVVDTGPVFDEGLVTILDYADEVITVVDMDLPSVKNAKVALDRLRQIGFSVDEIRLVVNRVNSKARLDLVELERSLGLRVGGSVPSDRLVPQSVNEGIPVLALSPRSKVARAFHALAESLDDDAARERLNRR